MTTKNEAAQEELKELIESVNQADKIFIRNKLSMTWTEVAEGDFLLAIALWKKRSAAGNPKTEWEFVMQMTDNEIAVALGLDLEELAAAVED